MWTRKSVKQRGKKAFYLNYWKCVLVALILCFVIGAAGGNSSGGSYSIPALTSQFTNSDTDTDTDTKTDIDTDTTTNTNTKSRGGGSNGDDDSFNIWKQLDADGVDAIYAEYPESGGFLIEEVAADVRVKKKRVRNAVSYVLGYAKRVGWDDKADHFAEVVS